MLGTYASLAFIFTASAVVGQALFVLCGRREWTPLAPAAGLCLLCPIAWWPSFLLGDALAGLGALLAAAALAVAVLRRAARPLAGIDADARPVLLGAVLLGSVPFLLELRFGILGTGLNPDMSQHLFAADRLLSGGEERLVEEGYPLGPHAIAASVSQAGPSLVQAFNGLTLAIACCASLAPLVLLRDLGRARRITAALLVGFAYLLASFLVQGAFKETMQALVVLAFAIGLTELAAGRLGGPSPERRWGRLGAVPLAALAVGSIYAYSFPGLAWIVGTLGVWAVVEVVLWRRGAARTPLMRPAVAALVFAAALAAPEVPRMIDFASFETFDPDGPGLGNLFNPLSPIEALGVWPSGDFRLDAGAGVVPAFVFYLGGALGLGALALGLRRALRRREHAIIAAAVASALLYLYAVIDGTPYQEAKTLVILAPAIALVAVRAVMERIPSIHSLRDAGGRDLLLPLAGLAFLAAAAGSSALALVNGPVGPSRWSPALTEFNQSIGDEPILAVAEDGLITEQNASDLISWELRGHEVCVVSERDAQSDAFANRSYGAVVVVGEVETPLPVVGRLEEVASEDGYKLFDATLAGPAPDCPFIADGNRAEPSDG